MPNKRPEIGIWRLGLASAVLDYFSLWSEVPALGGPGRARTRQAVLFVGVLVGALSKVVYDAAQSSGPMEWLAFAVAAVASVVVFPYVYYHAGLNRGQLTLAKWCLAFQNGFFWSVTMGALAGAT